MDGTKKIKKLFEEKRAIIFDFDGVIVDSEKYWPVIQTRFIGKYIPWDAKKQAEFTGMSQPNVAQILVEKYNFPLSIQEYLDGLDAEISEMYRSMAKLNPGFLEFFEKIRNEGKKYCIATSSNLKWVKISLKATGIEQYFTDEQIVSVQALGLKSKPDPEVFDYAIKTLHAKPEEAVIIEDSHNGILAAKASGATAVGLINGLSHEMNDVDGADFMGTFAEF